MDKAAEMMIFCRTVESGSFSAAARELSLTPSAVSKQISRLEDRLGTRLINRTTRRLNLTEEGRAFYERSRSILVDIAEAERVVSEAQGRPRGRLRINAPVSFGRRQLVPLMPRFMAANPEVEIELELSDRTVDLVKEGGDVMLRVGELHDSSLVARRLASIRRTFCAAPDYLARHGTPRTPEDLLRHNCLRLSHQSSYNDWVFDGPDGERVIHVRGNFTSNITGVLHSAVLAGIGVARMGEFMIAADVEAGRLVPLLTDYTRDTAPLYVVYPHRRHLAPKIRAFVDFLVEHFTPVPPWDAVAGGNGGR